MVCVCVCVGSVGGVGVGVCVWVVWVCLLRFFSLTASVHLELSTAQERTALPEFLLDNRMLLS